MARRAIEVHPEAIAEARAAWLWYSERSEQAGRAFMQELDRAIELIRESPERWPSYLHQTRRCLMHRFPYLWFIAKARPQFRFLPWRMGGDDPGIGGIVVSRPMCSPRVARRRGLVIRSADFTGNR